MGKTFVEKVFGNKAGREVRAGEIVSVEPDFVMSHDNAAAISATFKKIGIDKIKYPERVVIILDHEIPAPKESSAINHQEIREFVKKQNITHFFDISRLGHRGIVVPGTGNPEDQCERSTSEIPYSQGYCPLYYRPDQIGRS
jgi:homoaconitase/3-isopropylmalate dehydratase large subunit